VVDRVRAKLVGATAFLSKPIDSAQVLSVLKQFTDTAMPT
jgi:FixJ family two-component response regulator